MTIVNPYQFGASNDIIPAGVTDPTTAAALALVIGAKNGIVHLAPLGSGDGSARLQAVLNACAGVCDVWLTQGTHALNTKIDLPNKCTLRAAPGVAITSTLASTGGHTSSIFSTDRTATLAHNIGLATAAVVGDSSIYILDPTGYALGGFLSMYNFTGFADWSTYEITKEAASTTKGGTHTGSVDLTGLTYPGDFGVKNITLTVNGTAHLLTFSSPANAGDVVTQLNAAILAAFGTQVVTAALVSAKYLKLTGAVGTGIFSLTDGTLAAATIGWTSAAGVVPLDRVLSIAWDATNTLVQQYDPCQSADVDLGGATITAGCDRAFDIVGGWKCRARNFKCIWTAPPSGPAQNESVVAIDNASYDCKIENFEVEGNTYAAIGFSIEGSEACVCTGARIKGVDCGFHLPTAYRAIVHDAVVSSKGYVASFDCMTGGTRGSRQCQVDVHSSGGTYGANFTMANDNELTLVADGNVTACYITAGSSRNRIKLVSTNATSYGVYIDDTTAVPVGNILEEVVIKGAPVGVALLGGRDTLGGSWRFEGCGTAIRYEGTAHALVASADVEITTTPAYGVYIASAGDHGHIGALTVRSTQAVAAAWEGIHHAHTGTLHVCKLSGIGNSTSYGWLISNQSTGTVNIDSCKADTLQYPFVFNAGSFNWVHNRNIGTVGATFHPSGSAAACNWGTFVANEATEVVVANTLATTGMKVLVGLNTVGGTPAGQPYQSAITAGTSFGMKSAAGDTSTYNYELYR